MSEFIETIDGQTLPNKDFTGAMMEAFGIAVYLTLGRPEQNKLDISLELGQTEGEMQSGRGQLCCQIRQDRTWYLEPMIANKANRWTLSGGLARWYVSTALIGRGGDGSQTKWKSQQALAQKRF